MAQEVRRSEMQDARGAVLGLAISWLAVGVTSPHWTTALGVSLFALAVWAGYDAWMLRQCPASEILGQMAASLVVLVGASGAGMLLVARGLPPWAVTILFLSVAPFLLLWFADDAWRAWAGMSGLIGASLAVSAGWSLTGNPQFATSGAWGVITSGTASAGLALCGILPALSWARARMTAVDGPVGRAPRHSRRRAAIEGGGLLLGAYAITGIWLASLVLVGGGVPVALARPLSLSAGGPGSAAIAVPLATIVSFAVMFWFGMQAERRHRLAARLAMEEERERVARDAHDRVYNRLAALATSIETDALAENIPLSASASLGRSARDIRSTSAGLHEILSGDVARRTDETNTASGSSCTAEATLQDVCASQASRYRMTIACHGADNLGNVDAKAVYQIECIVEEALTNAAKHGDASHAWVDFEVDGPTLHLTVRDDGSGAKESAQNELDATAHHGLDNMRERADSLGGSVTLERVGDFTVLAAVLPIVDNSQRS